MEAGNGPTSGQSFTPTGRIVQKIVKDADTYEQMESGKLFHAVITWDLYVKLQQVCPC
jgi:hypothetical protein